MQTPKIKISGKIYLFERLVPTTEGCLMKHAMPATGGILKKKSLTAFPQITLLEIHAYTPQPLKGTLK
jgi:hypothetical protein